MLELFKDEVRALGRELDLPESLVGRHPFPGPGLAIRIPGPVSPEKCDILRKADAIYIEEIRRAGRYEIPSIDPNPLSSTYAMTSTRDARYGRAPSQAVRVGSSLQ